MKKIQFSLWFISGLIAGCLGNSDYFVKQIALLRIHIWLQNSERRMFQKIQNELSSRNSTFV